MPPTNPASHGLGRWPAATVAGLAIALTGLAGCDGSDDASSETTTAQRPSAQRSADPVVVERIPLGSTTNQVVAQLGRPARIERGRPPSPKRPASKSKPVAQTCYFYGVTGGRPTDEISMCFARGKLASVLTIRAKK